MNNIKKLLSIVLSLCLVVGLAYGVQVTTKADDGEGYDSDYYYYDQDYMDYYEKYELKSNTMHVFAKMGDKVKLSTYVTDIDGNKLDNPNLKFYYRWYKYQYGIDGREVVSKSPYCVIPSVNEADFQTQNGEGTFFICEIYVSKNQNEEDAVEDGEYDSIKITISNKESKNYSLEDNSNDRGEEEFNDDTEGFIRFRSDEGTMITLSPDVIDAKANKTNSSDSKFSYKWYKCKIGLNEKKQVATGASYTINSIAKSDYYADSDDINEFGTYFRCELYVDGVLTDYILYGLYGYGFYNIYAVNEVIYANIGDSVKLDTYVEKYMKGKVDSNNTRFSYSWDKCVKTGTKNWRFGFSQDLGVNTSSYTINSVSQEDYAFEDSDDIGDNDEVVDTTYTCTLYVDDVYMSEVEFKILPMTSEAKSYYLDSEETTKYAKEGNTVTLSATVKQNDSAVDVNNSRFSFKWYRYRNDKKENSVLSTKSSLVINSFDEDDFYDTGNYDTYYVCELYVDGNKVSSEDFYVKSELGMYKLFAKGSEYSYANIGDEVTLSTYVTCNDVVMDSNDSRLSYKWYKVTDYDNDIRTKLSGNSDSYEITSISKNDYYVEKNDCPFYECELYVNGEYARSELFYICPPDENVGGDCNNINVGNVWILKEGVVQSDLPNGIAYDEESNTLKLDSYSDEGQLYDETNQEEPYLLAHWWGNKSSIFADGDLNIIVSGTSTLSGTVGIDGKLKIGGTGTININTNEESQFGLFAERNIGINDAIINISGANKNSAFYGISLMPWAGYSDDHYNCNIKINNSNININSTVNTASEKNAITNVGIDAQDADLIINNSQVNVELTHGWAVGYGAGLYSDYYDKAFGGKLSVDSKSIVRFSAIDNDVPDHIYATYYYEDDINGEYYYTGLKSPGISRTKKQAVLYKSDDISGRKECKDAFMEITPNYRESDYSSVSSGDESVPDNPETQPNETTKPSSNQNETSAGDNSQTPAETNGNGGSEQVTTKTPVINVPTTKAPTTKKTNYSYSQTTKKKVTLKLKVKKRKVKAKKLKKRKVVVKNAIKAKLGNYKLHYTKVSGSSRLKVNKKGYIIVKKKTKKGTYKIRVNIWSFNAGGSCDKYVTVKIRVK